MRNNRIAASTNELVVALTFARSEAMKRGDTVTTCASDDEDSCAGSNDWGTGWIVFVDLDQNGAREVNEPLLQVWPAIGGGLELEASRHAVRSVHLDRPDGAGDHERQTSS